MTTPTLLALADKWDRHAADNYTDRGNCMSRCADDLRRALAAPQVEIQLPGLLEMSDLLRRVGVETKSFHDQQVAEAAYRAGYQAALNARAGGGDYAEKLCAEYSRLVYGVISFAPSKHAIACMKAARASQAVGVGS